MCWVFFIVGVVEARSHDLVSTIQNTPLINPQPHSKILAGVSVNLHQSLYFYECNQLNSLEMFKLAAYPFDISSLHHFITRVFS